MHNATSISVRYLCQKHPFGFNHLYNNTCTCIVYEEEIRKEKARKVRKQPNRILLGEGDESTFYFRWNDCH